MNNLPLYMPVEEDKPEIEEHNKKCCKKSLVCLLVLMTVLVLFFYVTNVTVDMDWR